jgi:hypothetical protein
VGPQARGGGLKRDGRPARLQAGSGWWLLKKNTETKLMDAMLSKMAVVLLLLSSIATHLFVGVETAFPVQNLGADTHYYSGDLLPRKGKGARSAVAACGAEEGVGGAPLLLLPPAVGCESEVFQSNAPVQPARCEEAGASHHLLLRLRAGIEDLGEERSRSASAGVKGAQEPEDSPEQTERKAVRAGMAGQEDHYDILGLAEVRWRATDDQIKKAYHRTSLRCHPGITRALLSLKDAICA